jgi:hypothetical protein
MVHLCGHCCAKGSLRECRIRTPPSFVRWCTDTQAEAKARNKQKRPGKAALTGLLHIGFKDVDGHGDPDLRRRYILGCAEERLDSQMLFDPLEKRVPHASAIGRAE